MYYDDGMTPLHSILRFVALALALVATTASASFHTFVIESIYSNADGSILWWAFYGSNELVKFDPLAQKILKSYPLPSGGGGGAYAVTVDGAGFPWVNEISGNTVVRLDPATEKMQVIKLPTTNTGIRKMIIAADGRLWYMGSHTGKLGVIE